MQQILYDEMFLSSISGIWQLLSNVAFLCMCALVFVALPCSCCSFGFHLIVDVFPRFKIAIRIVFSQ